MYRVANPPALIALASSLDLHLGPHGFVIVEPDDRARAAGVTRGYLRKTWNTNRGVLLTRSPSPEPAALRGHVELLRREGGRLLGSSWWSQLGVQLVLLFDAATPPEPALQALVDMINTQGVLIQSVFAVDLTSGAHTSARTWGQFVTGKFQDAIDKALGDVRVTTEGAPKS